MDEEGRPRRDEGAELPADADGFFERLVAHAAEGILVADQETRRFLYANPAICSLLGFPAAELTRLSLSDIHPAEALTSVLEEFCALSSGGKSVALAVPCRRMDGGVIYADIVGASVDLAGRSCSVGFFTDATERTRAERLLREREEEERLVLESIPEMVYRVDFAGGDPMRSALGLVSGNVEGVLGLPRSRFLEDPALWENLLHPDDREAVAERTRAILATGGGLREYRLRHGETSEYRWLEDRVVTRRAPDGRVVGFFGVARDVTARRQVENELRESARILSESQRVGRLGSYRLDVAAGLWTSSPVLDEIFGIVGVAYPRDVPGWASIVHPEERAAMTAYFVDEVLGRRARFDREYRIQRISDGAVRQVHGLGELVLDSAGRPVEMIGTIQDVTERREAEQEKLELERRLLHAQKLESLGVLAGGIAHDFNNLLMSILGNLELAQMRLPVDSPAAENCRNARQAAERSADLTRQMLAYSGRGATAIRDLDLGRLVEENVHLLRAMIAKNVALVLDLAPDRPLLRGDAGQLQQVVMNLITNASEAIGERPGTIRLSTRRQECDAGLLARTRAAEVAVPGPYVVLEVSDDGCGMDEATRQRLFDPFFTTKSMGRGLGTSAILGIVTRHRGAILVDSSPGQGTTFRVLLPAAVSNAAADAPAEKPPDGPREPAAEEARRQTTVLVVDGEPAVLAVARDMLLALGHAVLTAQDGVEALNLVRERPGAIDCVVLDLSMPRLDGPATLRELMRLLPGVRAILASGYSRDEALGRFGSDEVVAFLQKPYTVSDLMGAVEVALQAPGAPAGSPT